MSTDQGLAVQLAHFVHDLTCERLSGSLIQKAKVFLLDWLGSVYAGTGAEPTRIATALAADLGGNPESSVIPDNSKSSCLMASLVNGMASHVVEMDDLHRESIFHPAAAILPAVFAVGERQHCPGRDLIAAIVAGYEIGIRAAIAVGKSHYHFWHTTGTCGTFGAGAGAGKILGLDPERLAWALGSAGTQASGLWEFLVEGAMSKQLHTGKAACNGLLAALLAERGFTGAKRIFEGDKGFFRATSRDFDETRLLAGLGEEFVTARNSLKYYASCGHTHSAIDATLQAMDATPLDPHAVESVHVSVYQAALDLLGGVKAESPYSAKFNLPFCIASAVKFGKVGLDAFSRERLQDQDIKDLMERVNLKAEPSLSAVYPRKWPARVEIRLKDGRALEGFNAYPKGDPENPLTEQECVDKFKQLTKAALSEPNQSKIVEAVLHLEDLSDSADLLAST
jgi:2-methylcitrate dehydratase PrpD